MENDFLNIPINFLRLLDYSNNSTNSIYSDNQMAILSNSTTINSSNSINSMNNNSELFNSMISAMQSISDLINNSSNNNSFLHSSNFPIIYTAQPDNNNDSFSIFSNNSLNNSNLNNLTIINNTNITTVGSGCQLLGDFGYIVQGILGIMCFFVLVCKFEISIFK